MSEVDQGLCRASVFLGGHEFICQLPKHPTGTPEEYQGRAGRGHWFKARRPVTAEPPKE